MSKKSGSINEKGFVPQKPPRSPSPPKTLSDGYVPAKPSPVKSPGKPVKKGK